MSLLHGGNAATNSCSLAARHLRLGKPHRTCGVHALQRKDALGEIDSSENNRHDSPSE